MKTLTNSLWWVEDRIKGAWPLVAQVLFGWDASIALAMFVIWTTALAEPFTVLGFIMAWFGAYAPDLDLLIFYWKGRKWGMTQGHWVLGHYPVIVIPIVAFIGWLVGHYVAPGHERYYIFMVTFGTIFHFIHDGIHDRFHYTAPFMPDGRIEWHFWDPWKWQHWVIDIRKATEAETMDLYARTTAMARKEGRDSELTERVEHVTVTQLKSYCFWLFLVVILAAVLQFKLL